MKRKFKILNYIVTYGAVIALVFLTVSFCSNKHGLVLKDMILPCLLGLVVAGFVCTLFHELGHLIFGKINGFYLLSIVVWFFRLSRSGKKLKFGLTFNLEEAGYTSMVKKDCENIKKGLKNMTIGGIVFSLITMLLGILGFFFEMPYILRSMIICLLPVGSYFFFGNALPNEEGGARNDGGVLYGISKNDYETQVMYSLLAIQSELYNGKTFCEIDEKYYFEVPQLPEDSLNFITLLNYRFYYYVDKKDFENANKVIERLLCLEDYIPASAMTTIKTDALYSYCTFNLDVDRADDLMYELEKPLNKVNSATSLRVKLAYNLAVRQENEFAIDFYKKGKKEAKKSQLSGLKVFEVKLLDRLKEEYKF